MSTVPPKKCQGGPYCVIVATMMMHVHKTSTSSVRGKVFDAIKGQELKIGISFLCPTISYCLSFAVERSSQHISRRFFGHPAPLSKTKPARWRSHLIHLPNKQDGAGSPRLRDAENSKFKCFPIEQAVPPILFSRWFRIYINLHKVFKYGYFAAKWNPHHCVCRIINSVFKKIIHGQRETYGFLGPHGDIKCLLRALPTRPKISGSLLFCSRYGRKGRMFENVPVSRSVTCSNSFAGWRHVHKSPN